MHHANKHKQINSFNINLDKKQINKNRWHWYFRSLSLRMLLIFGLLVTSLQGALGVVDTGELFLPLYFIYQEGHQHHYQLPTTTAAKKRSWEVKFTFGPMSVTILTWQTAWRVARTGDTFLQTKVAKWQSYGRYNCVNIARIANAVQCHS